MASRRGNKWQASVRLGGKQYRYLFASEGDALLWEQQARKDYAEGKSIVPPTETRNLTLGVLEERLSGILWTGHKDEKGSRSALSRIVASVGPDVPAGDLTTVHLTNARDHLLREGNTTSTVNRKFCALNRLLTAAQERSLIQTVPKVKALREGNGRARFFTEDELKQIFEQFDLLGDPVEAALTRFLFYTGGRFSEVCAVTWRDITDNRVRLVHTKSGKPRSVPLAKPALTALRAVQDQPVGPFNKVVYETYHSHWLLVRDALGYRDDKEFVIHTLRHSTASHLALNRHDIRRIKEWMGHESIQTTMRYAHLIPGAIDGMESTFDTMDNL